jgi:acetyl esterase/lipase
MRRDVVDAPTPRFDPDALIDFDIKEVEYGRFNGQSWLARVYQPAGEGPFPTLLDLHGGAWSTGHRATDEVIHRALAASGILVVAPDFRLAPEFPYPASIADTNLATRWLKAHAADFNGTAHRLGVRGGSSGGHQAMLSAMRPSDPRYTVHSLPEAPDVDASVAYVIACWSILDPYARYAFARDTGRDDLVRRTEGFFLSEQAMQEGSPS